MHFFSNVSGHSASTERPAPRRPSRSKAAPKDIESLISNNLMKLRSLSPSSKAAKATDEGSNLIYDRLEMFLGHFGSNIRRGRDTLLLTCHYSSEKRGLNLMKCSCKTNENLLFPLMNALVVNLHEMKNE